MNILQINKSKNLSNSDFKGKPILTKSSKYMTNGMRKALLQSEGMKALTENNDVVIRAKVDLAGPYDSIHTWGTILYKIQLSVLKENSILERLKDALHIKPRYNLTQNFHQEEGSIKCMDDYHFGKIIKRVNKK